MSASIKNTRLKSSLNSDNHHHSKPNDSIPNKLKDKLILDRKSFISWKDIKKRTGYYLALSDKRFANLTGKGITVAIIDSGYEHNSHFVKKRKFLQSHSFGYLKKNIYIDDLGHGTHMSGIINAQFSMSRNTMIFHRKIYGFNSTNPFNHLEQALLDILNGCNKNGTKGKLKLPDIINMSLGDGCGYINEDNISNRYGGNMAALKRLEEKGVIIVTSSGNSYIGKPGLTFPAICSACLSVSAVQKSSEKISKGKYEPLPSSQYIQKGKYKTNIFAPGDRIPTIDIDKSKDLILSCGTSPAASIVSSSIALFKEFYLLHKKNDSIKFNNNLIKKILSSSTQNIYVDGNKSNPSKLLNVYDSLQKLDQLLNL